ncbi:MAG: chorismate synthase [Acholeplasmataceae bacterium]
MNSFGHLFKITLYGESHQPAIGVVIDGVTPGTPIDQAKIKDDLMKRNPVAIGTTPRKEPDAFEITSGIKDDVATGSPIHLTIKNVSVISKDYDHLKNHPRPGHADLVAGIKYNQFHDHRGGGRFSGRLTAPLVAAGSIAKMMLPYQFSHELVQVGTLTDLSHIDEYLTEVTENKDSVGGIIEVTVLGLPIGLGEPMFEKLDAKIAQMLFSIPAVKGVEFGTGFQGIHLKGSEFNDAIINDQGKTLTNHSGGVSGGISNGNPLVVRVFIKPTSSIKKDQQTYAVDDQKIKTLAIEGRHDVCIARRAGIVIENAVALVCADMYLLNKMYQ